MDVVWFSMVKKSLCHQSLQDPVLIRESVHTLGHMTGSLNPQLEQKVNQVKVSTGMVVPIPITLHAKSDSGWQRIGTGVLVSRIPGPVIRSERLAGNDVVLKGAMSEVGVVLERHDDGGDDDEDSNWTMNFFYVPRSCTIPKVV